MWYFAEIASRGTLGLSILLHPKANFKKILFTHSTFTEQTFYFRHKTRCSKKIKFKINTVMYSRVEIYSVKNKAG